MSRIEHLKDVYRNLFDANLAGAEDDYLSYYEGTFGPEVLDSCDSDSDVISHICHLAEEIFNDTGSEETTLEWLVDAGAEDEIIALCGF